MVLPWKAGNYLGLPDGNVHVVVRRILDEKTGVQGEDFPSSLGSVFVAGLWKKAALLPSLSNQHTHVINNENLFNSQIWQGILLYVPPP